VAGEGDPPHHRAPKPSPKHNNYNPPQKTPLYKMAWVLRVPKTQQHVRKSRPTIEKRSPEMGAGNSFSLVALTVVRVGFSLEKKKQKKKQRGGWRLVCFYCGRDFCLCLVLLSAKKSFFFFFFLFLGWGGGGFVSWGGRGWVARGGGRGGVWRRGGVGLGGAVGGGAAVARGGRSGGRGRDAGCRRFGGGSGGGGCGGAFCVEWWGGTTINHNTQTKTTNHLKWAVYGGGGGGGGRLGAPSAGGPLGPGVWGVTAPQKKKTLPTKT